MNTISRRVFLAGLGASPALLPLVAPRRAWGAPAYPRRLLVLVKPNGTDAEQFWPAASLDKYGHPSYASGPLAAMVRPSIIQPLEPYIDDLVFVRGMTWVAHTRMKGVDAHQTGLQILTGKSDPRLPSIGEDARPGTGVSIDQWIASEIARTTRLAAPLLTLGVSCLNSTWGWLSFRDYAQPNSPEVDPYALFTKVFGDPKVSTADLDRLRAERKSILDYLGPALTRFGKRLGTDDRSKVDSHLQALRGLEQQLSAPVGVKVTPKLGQPLDVKADVNIPAVANAQMDLVVAAFAGDAARVATFALMDQLGNHAMTWLGADFAGPASDASLASGGIRTHHDITHRAGDNDDTRRRKRTAETWFMGQLAALLGKLKAVKEGAGTMLDNTMVVYIDALSGGGNHTFDTVPIIIAGGAGGYLKTGRMVNFRTGTTDLPQNGLLCAMANAMGYPRDSFGDADLGGEPAGLRS